MHNATKEDYLNILEIEKTKGNFKNIKAILEDKVKQYNDVYDNLKTKYHTYYKLQITDVLLKMPTHNELKNDLATNLETRKGIKLNNITELELHNLLKEYMTSYKMYLRKDKKYSKRSTYRSRQREIERQSIEINQSIDQMDPAVQGVWND
jgi:hypothetical protein